jgi:hypothetical protein
VAAANQAAKRVAIVAALYPLWGALAVLIADHFFALDALPVALFIGWLIVAAIEERVFRIPFGRHIVGAAVLGLCWFALTSHDRANRFIPVAFVTQTVSRAAAIALIWVSRPDKQGMLLARETNTISAGIAIASGGAVAVTLGIRTALVMVLACFLIMRVVREWYYRRFGGVSTTAFSITQRVTELSTLLIAVFVR